MKLHVNMDTTDLTYNDCVQAVISSMKATFAIFDTLPLYPSGKDGANILNPYTREVIGSWRIEQ